MMGGEGRGEAGGALLGLHNRRRRIEDGRGGGDGAGWQSCFRDRPLLVLPRIPISLLPFRLAPLLLPAAGSLTTGWVAWRHLQKWWAGRTALGYGEAHPLLGAADGGPRPSPLPRRTSALTSPQLQQLRGVAEAPEGEEDGAEDAGLGASRRPLR